MPLPDLLRLTELALSGNSSPNLPEDLLRLILEETSSRAGTLGLDDRIVARWPPNLPKATEESGDGCWTETTLGGDPSRWLLRLLQPERMEEIVLGSARLALRAWDLREELKRARFDERFHLWELEAIRSIATSIGGLLDPTRLAEELISHLVALLGVRSARIYLGDSSKTAECVGNFGSPVLTPEELERALHQPIYRDEVVALPLQSSSGTLGVLAAGHKEARAGTEPFTSNDVRLLELFAVQVTLALEYMRLTQESLERELLRQELEVAAVIQSHLYPQEFPQLKGFRLAARSSPSRHVAGDSYDVLVRGDCLIAAVTDVSGKGVGAGLIASGVHAGLRLLAEEAELPLAQLALRLNGYLVGATADNRFATMALLRMDEDGDLAAVNAGHCPVLIRRADGSIDTISSSGLPIGILAAASYAEESRRLNPGDLIVLYTDGVTEAENPEEEEFGVERVAQVLSQLAEPTADHVCEELLHAVDEFTGGKPLHDDATLLVIERLKAV
jgi:sigma-B regulation protein RsbU (phosphoserine phosphatase)